MKPLHALLLTLAAAVFVPASQASAKPNVVVFLADDLGWGETGAQGIAKDVPTPNIDSIAKGGVRFTSGYVSGPYCSPTRAGFMTGRYQQRFGHEFNPGPAEQAVEGFGLSLKEATFGDRMKSAGYTTAWVGKSHLGYQPDFHPLKRGFDYYYGFLGGAHGYFKQDDQHNPVLKGTEVVPEIEYTTDDFAREAVGFIDRTNDKPFFLYLAFNAVHTPMHATEKYLARFPNITDPKRKAMAAMLSAMDDGIGAVQAKVRELGQEENTLFVFFTDNGGPTPSNAAGNGPLRGFKSQTWEGGVRVPFMMQWKGRIPAGQVDDRPVIQLDLLPTALAASGADIDPAWKLDGVNLLPYVTGENKGNPHDTLFWRFGQQIALRHGDWKLIKAPNGGGIEQAGPGKASTENAQLYNLKEDIGEQNNLAAKEPEKFKELAALWNQFNSEMVEPTWGPRTRADGAKKKGPGKGKKKGKSKE